MATQVFLIRYRGKFLYQFQDTPASSICSDVQNQKPKSDPKRMPESAVGKKSFLNYFTPIDKSHDVFTLNVSWPFIHFSSNFLAVPFGKRATIWKRYSQGTQFEYHPGYRLPRQRLSCFFSVSIYKWRAGNLKQSHSLPNHHSWSYSFHSKLLTFTDKRMQFYLRWHGWIKHWCEWVSSKLPSLSVGYVLCEVEAEAKETVEHLMSRTKGTSWQ